MIAAIRYNLSNLTNFSGRQGRSPFWFYVLFLAVIQMVISFVISIGMTGPMMADVFSSVQQGLSETEIQARMFERLGGMLRTTVWVSVGTTLIMTTLVAAAFTRRLHDANKSGWIAVFAVVIQLAALVMQVVSIDAVVRLMVIAQTGDIVELQEAQGRLMINGLIAWVPLLVIVVFGVWPSSPGANRYGPAAEDV